MTTEAEVASSPESKKQKMVLEQSPDEEWPEAWLMPDNVEDPCEENRLDPDVKLIPADLKKLGICYWKMPDMDKFEYPIKAVPWDPQDAVDPKLKQLRDDRGYSYADIITIHPDHLPEFECKIKSFFEEHSKSCFESRVCKV